MFLSNLHSGNIGKQLSVHLLILPAYQSQHSYIIRKHNNVLFALHGCASRVMSRGQDIKSVVLLYSVWWFWGSCNPSETDFGCSFTKSKIQLQIVAFRTTLHFRTVDWLRDVLKMPDSLSTLLGMVSSLAALLGVTLNRMRLNGIDNGRIIIIIVSQENPVNSAS